MKETKLQTQEEVRETQPAQHAKKPVLIHRMKPQPGQKLFEYNMAENTLYIAEFSMPGTISYTQAMKNAGGAKKKVDVKPNHLYVLAINFKNAVKQLRKMIPLINPTIVK